LIFSVSLVSAQRQERDTILCSRSEVDTLFSSVTTPVFSLGVSGGAAFLNPEAINNQIEFNNSVFNESQSSCKDSCPMDGVVLISAKKYADLLFCSR